jgi:hypothetical protein
MTDSRSRPAISDRRTTFRDQEPRKGRARRVSERAVITLLLFRPAQGHEVLGEERAEDGRVIVAAVARK